MQTVLRELRARHTAEELSVRTTIKSKFQKDVYLRLMNAKKPIGEDRVRQRFARWELPGAPLLVARRSLRQLNEISASHRVFQQLFFPQLFFPRLGTDGAPLGGFNVVRGSVASWAVILVKTRLNTMLVAQWFTTLHRRFSACRLAAHGAWKSLLFAMTLGLVKTR